jgi:hypothetical protein
METQKVVWLWQDGWRSGLVVTTGPKWVSVITLKSERVSVTRIPRSEERHFRPVDHSPAEYRKKLRRRFKKWGGSQEARKFIRG